MFPIQKKLIIIIALFIVAANYHQAIDIFIANNCYGELNLRITAPKEIN